MKMIKKIVNSIPGLRKLLHGPYQRLKKIYHARNVEVLAQIKVLETQTNLLINQVTALHRRADQKKDFFHLPSGILGVPQEEWQIAAKLQQQISSDSSVTQWLKQFIRSGMTVLDIGASVGQYSILIAKALQNHGKLHAFEPTPRIHTTLLQNIRVNGLAESGSIETHALCVTNEWGVVRLYDYVGESERNNIYTGEDEKEYLLAPSTSLDEFFPPGTLIDLIKISIEGAEALAFQGMKRVLADNPNIRILVDVIPSRIKQAWMDLFTDWKIEHIDSITLLMYRGDE